MDSITWSGDNLNEVEAFCARHRIGLEVGTPRIRWYHRLWDTMMWHLFWRRGYRAPELTPRMDPTLLEISEHQQDGWHTMTVKIGDTITSAGQVI